MQKPIIHLNGTAAKDLLEQQTTLAWGLRAALGALEMAAPHGRDYYPLGDRAFTIAVEEHRARVVKLREVLEETEALAEHIAEFVK